MQTKKQADKGQSVYPLRLPVDVKTQLTAEAAKSHRSLNGEIVSRLEKSLEFSETTQKGVQQ